MFSCSLLLLGTIPSGFPSFGLTFSFQNGEEFYSFTDICKNLGSSIFVSPLVAILEPIAIAKAICNLTFLSFDFQNLFLFVFDGILAKGKKVDASQEMIAIGLSNIFGSFGSSFPVTGSFSRTAVNASSGVRTPFGGVYTGIRMLTYIHYYKFNNVYCIIYKSSGSCPIGHLRVDALFLLHSKELSGCRYHLRRYFHGRSSLG